MTYKKSKSPKKAETELVVDWLVSGFGTPYLVVHGTYEQAREQGRKIIASLVSSIGNLNKAELPAIELNYLTVVSISRVDMTKRKKAKCAKS